MLYANWNDVPRALWPYQNFTPQELACRHTGQLLVVPETLSRLQLLRQEYGQPMPVTSGYRSPEHPVEVKKKSLSGAHVQGRGFDIAMFGDTVPFILLASKHGFTGIGVKQHGRVNRRFIHIDDIPSGAEQPRPWSWSYK